MPQTVLMQAIRLYWAFVPEVSVMTHETFDTWQWRYCVELARFIEGMKE